MNPFLLVSYLEKNKEKYSEEYIHVQNKDGDFHTTSILQRTHILLDSINDLEEDHFYHRNKEVMTDTEKKLLALIQKEDTETEKIRIINFIKSTIDIMDFRSEYLGFPIHFNTNFSYEFQQKLKSNLSKESLISLFKKNLSEPKYQVSVQKNQKEYELLGTDTMLHKMTAEDLAKLNGSFDNAYIYNKLMSYFSDKTYDIKRFYFSSNSTLDYFLEAIKYSPTQRTILDAKKECPSLFSTYSQRKVICNTLDSILSQYPGLSDLRDFYYEMSVFASDSGPAISENDLQVSKIFILNWLSQNKVWNEDTQKTFLEKWNPIPESEKAELKKWMQENEKLKPQKKLISKILKSLNNQ